MPTGNLTAKSDSRDVSRQTKPGAKRRKAKEPSEFKYEPEDVIDMFICRLANEAYRYLPALLKDRYKITVIGRMFRRDVGRMFVNLLGDAEREGTKALIVGEVGSKLEAKHFARLKRRVKRVAQLYEDLNGREIIPMIVAHHAPDPELRRAERQGVIVVQSWEW
jgi:hypothetical protein